MRNNYHGKDFVVGAMIGSTLGALAALLLTSKKGHKVQKELINKYHEFENAVKSYAKKKSHKVQKELIAKYNEIQGTLKTYSKKGKKLQKAWLQQEIELKKNVKSRAKPKRKVNARKTKIHALRAHSYKRAA